MKTETLNVTGMTCGSCVAHVKSALGALPGVESVEVSLPDSRAEVRFDESKLTLESMADALKSAGYGMASTSTPTAKHGGCCS